jgi:hypothetical protein
VLDDDVRKDILECADRLIAAKQDELNRARNEVGSQQIISKEMDRLRDWRSKAAKGDTASIAALLARCG